MMENILPPPVTFELAVTDSHFEQILELQRKNHLNSIHEDQQLQDGFVFAEHDMRLLKLMAAKQPQVIALAAGKVIGYNLAMDCSMEDELPSLKPMFEEFKNWSYEGKPLLDYRFIVGGQVCVDSAFRGRGLIRNLYQETKNLVGEHYDLCITEIAVRNSKSLRAHSKLGFQVLGNYDDGAETWNLVVWKYR